MHSTTDQHLRASAHRHSLSAALLISLFGCTSAQAEVVTHIYNLTDTTAETLKSLGTSFTLGCTCLAVAIVTAAAILRKR